MTRKWHGADIRTKIGNANSCGRSSSSPDYSTDDYLVSRLYPHPTRPLFNTPGVREMRVLTADVAIGVGENYHIHGATFGFNRFGTFSKNVLARPPILTSINYIYIDST